MIVVRAIHKNDFEGFRRLAYASHVNFYTLPKNDKLLEHIFEKSLASFSSSPTAPGQEYYLFVAENRETKELLGVAALSALTGGNEPLFFFHKEYDEKQPILKAVTYEQGPSELCSLFVDESARGLGVGKLLSLARFLFAARFPERFTDTFISELRGRLVDNTSPFWEAVGRKFLDVDFTTVQEMLSHGRSFLQDILPKYPIYINLLPKDIQEVIGHVDKETEAAESLLHHLCFIATDDVDVIDAGPKLSANRADIMVFKNSKTLVVQEQNHVLEKPCLISNDLLDFRAIMGNVISLDTLQCNVGDTVRIYEL